MDKKTGHLYEKRLIQKYVQVNHLQYTSCPLQPLYNSLYDSTLLSFTRSSLISSLARGTCCAGNWKQSSDRGVSFS